MAPPTQNACYRVNTQRSIIKQGIDINGDGAPDTAYKTTETIVPVPKPKNFDPQNNPKDGVRCYSTLPASDAFYMVGYGIPGTHQSKTGLQEESLTDPRLIFRNRRGETFHQGGLARFRNTDFFILDVHQRAQYDSDPKTVDPLSSPQQFVGRSIVVKLSGRCFGRAVVNLKEPNSEPIKAQTVCEAYTEPEQVEQCTKDHNGDSHWCSMWVAIDEVESVESATPPTPPDTPMRTDKRR